MRIVAFVASIVAVLLSSSAAAQSGHGAGISGGASFTSSYDYVRVGWGPPDSARLVAAVLFKGSTEWGRSNARGWESNHAADSASRDAQAHGYFAGGTITPRAAAWTQYDARRGVVIVLNKEWKVPGRDSALVLLVDRIDRVGGDPVVDSAIVVVSPIAQPQDVGPHWRWMMQVDQNWERAIRSNAKVRNFLDAMRVGTPAR